MKFILAGIAILISQSTFAVGTRGGGNVIVCFYKKDDKLRHPGVDIASYHPIDERGRLKNVLLRDEDISQIESIESLDVAEAKSSAAATEGGKIISIENGESVDAYVDRILSPFHDIGSMIVDQIESARKVLPYSRMNPRSGVYPTEDFNTIGPLNRPECLLSSLVVQETINNANYFYKDERLWALASTQTRAVVFLHELVYFIYRSDGDTTSDAARKVVGTLITYLPKRTYGELALEIANLDFAVKRDDASWAYFPFFERLEKTFSKACVAKRQPYLRDLFLRAKEFLKPYPLYTGECYPLEVWDESRAFKAAQASFDTGEYRAAVVQFSNNLQGLLKVNIRTKPHKEEFFNIPAKMMKEISPIVNELKNYAPFIQPAYLETVQSVLAPMVEKIPALTGNEKMQIIHWFQERIAANKISESGEDRFSIVDSMPSLELKQPIPYPEFVLQDPSQNK